MMDQGIKTLVAEVFPDLERDLFGHTFSLDDACGLVAAYMFRRYGVSNYICSRDVKEVLTSEIDAQSQLQRAPQDGNAPSWKPAAL